MFDFFRSAFRGLFGLCVVLAVVGLFIGVIFAFGFHPLLGISVIVGGIVALIFSFGLISTILVMDERLEYIAHKIYESEKKSQISQGNASLSSQVADLSSVGNVVVQKIDTKKCSKCKKEVNEQYSKCPHCGNDSFE